MCIGQGLNRAWVEGQVEEEPFRSFLDCALIGTRQIKLASQ